MSQTLLEPHIWRDTLWSILSFSSLLKVFNSGGILRVKFKWWKLHFLCPFWGFSLIYGALDQWSFPWFYSGATPVFCVATKMNNLYACKTFFDLLVSCNLTSYITFMPYEENMTTAVYPVNLHKLSKIKSCRSCYVHLYFLSHCIAAWAYQNCL